jgi:Ca-activated chloride channel family protein
MGVGTPSGAPVPLPGGGLLEDAAGNIVLPKLVEEGLVTLARAGGGSYARLGADDSDLDQLLAERDAGQSRRDDAQQADFWIDSGHWLLWPLMALALLAIRRGLS